MGLERTRSGDDSPRRTGLQLRPSLNRELSALALIRGMKTSDLLNVVVEEYVRTHGVRASGRKGRPKSISA